MGYNPAGPYFLNVWSVGLAKNIRWTDFGQVTMLLCFVCAVPMTTMMMMMPILLNLSLMIDWRRGCGALYKQGQYFVLNAMMITRKEMMWR